MSLDSSTWGEWVDIPIEDIAQGSAINDDDSGFISDLFNNQEILREIQIATFFPEQSTSSATYVSLVTKTVWIPEWCQQPGSGKLSGLEFVFSPQVYVSGGGTASVRARINSGTWIEQTGITASSYGVPTRLVLPEADWVSAYGTEIDIDVEALTSAGTVFVRDISGCSMIRKLVP